MGNCICPRCKSKNVVPVIYGYPTSEALAASDRGDVMLGGCVIHDKAGGGIADRFCKDCEHEWCIEDFLAEDITKVRFRYWSNWGCFDPESMTEAQWAFDVFPNGTINYSSYPRASRRVLDKAKASVSTKRVIEFYQKVVCLYRPWTEIVECEVCDGCSYELCITYSDNRKKKMCGNLGGGTVDRTIMDFLCSIPEMKEIIEEDNEND